MIRIETQDTGKLLLRASVAFLLLLHGIHKLRHGIDGIIANVERHDLPAFIAYGVYLGEVAAPLLVLIGYQTRIAAGVMAFNMVIAIWLSHADDVLTLTKNGGWGVELAGLYLLGSIAIMLLGAGRYSLSRGNGRFD